MKQGSGIGDQGSARAPLHVSFMIDSLSYAGTELQLLALIRSLDRTRVQPSLVLLNGTSQESQSLEPSGCPILRLSLKSFKNLPATARAVARLAKFWQREHVDIVQTYFLDSTYFGVPVARALGIRRVIRVRNNVGHWLTPMHRGLGRFIGRIVDATITNSPAGRNALQKVEGGNPAKLTVLENGVNIDQFAAIRPKRRGDVINIGVMANLRRVKGVDIFLRAAAMVASSHQHVRFQIAGDGEQHADLERLTGELGIADRVTFLGRIRNVTGFISGLDVAVVPSRAEGMSNSLLEFMAAGRPLVATSVGANAELLAEDRGLLVPPEDTVALADAMIRLVDDVGLARRLGAAAQDHAIAHHGREKMIHQFEEYYLKMCA